MIFRPESNVKCMPRRC